MAQPSPEQQSNPQDWTRAPAQPPGYNPHLPPPKPRLTPEELQVLKACNSESFWYRCVPFSMIGITATQLAVSRGILKPHPRYGALMKNMAATLLGYILGKLSYQGACREKLMQLPNSPLAESLRSGKRGPGIMQDITGVPSYGSEGGTSYSTDLVNKSDESSSYMDVDTDSNIQAKGLDDLHRPSIERDLQARNEREPQQQFISYDELRKRNRDDYDRRMANSVAPPSELPPRQGPGSLPTYDRDQILAPKPIKKNKYGDIIEE